MKLNSNRLNLLTIAISYVLASPSSYATEVLPTITVVDDGIEQTSAGDVYGYQALTADSATKTRTPLKEIPQSIQVVTGQLMQDQQVQSVSEALKNVSGVITNNPLVTPAWESTLVRGFSAEQYQDGSNLNYNAGDRESIVNIERIEVLKGANAVLYGGNSGSPVGGAVNLVSKMPEKEAFSKIGATIGSNGLVKPSFDVNQPVSDSAQFRMTGEYSKSNSEIDVLEQKRYNLNPTLKLGIGANTSLLLQGKISRWEGQDYQGLPATGTVAGNFRIDRDLFVGNRNIPNSRSSLDSLTATLDHKLSSAWSISAKVRSANSDFDEKVQAFFGNAPVAGSSFGLTNIDLYQKIKDLSVTAEAKGEFRGDTSKTSVILGVENSTLDDEGYMGGMDFATYHLVDLKNPIFPTLYASPSVASRWSGKATNKTQGVYAQTQHDINNQLHLLGGVKLARVEVGYEDNYGADDRTDKTKLLPRVGVVYDFNEHISAFASYSEGMKGIGWANYTSTPKPIESQQKEVGVKFDVNKQLSGSLAVFQVNRENTGIPDPATGGMTSIPNGSEESKGTELDMVWQPTPKFSLLASYANTDAVYTKASGVIPAGNKVAGVPEHSGRIWANYKFKEGKSNVFSIGGGVYAQSETMITGSNDFKTPAFHTFDLKLGYETKQYETAFTIKNLADEQYYERYNYLGGRVAPGLGRTLILSTAIKF